MIIQKSPEQLTKEDAARQALEAAAIRIEQEHGNPVYMQAWKKAVKIIRDMQRAL